MRHLIEQQILIGLNSIWPNNPSKLAKPMVKKDLHGMKLIPARYGIKVQLFF